MAKLAFSDWNEVTPDSLRNCPNILFAADEFRYCVEQIFEARSTILEWGINNELQ